MDKDLLYRFFKGNTSLEEEMQIRKWVETSSVNRRVFFKERKIFDAMNLHADEKTAGKQIIKRSVRLHPLLKEIAKIAAIVILTLGGSFLYYQMQKTDEAAVAMQTVFVPTGQRVNITLPDGTNVWLNARTRLEYPVSFNHKDRTVALDGEAYFEVAKNENKPFIVQTSQGVIEVTGTAFNVDAYSSGKEFETTLMKGSVKVKLNNGLTGEEVRLTPDKKAILKKGKLQVEQVDDYTPYRWREGLICFKNESFVSIMNDFEKYYGVSVQVRNKKVLNSFYTGKFRHTDGIDYALRVLQKDIPFKYSRDDENQLIYIE
jgi:ferric-dicitrate binding protein FerR (iron transport regulator)